jgi:hypothetical protein
MIITDKFIFVHVPKTGGASMLQALNGPRKRGHIHAPLSSVERNNRPAFGFVRNPWDRMVSLYSYLCQKTTAPGLLAYQKQINEAGFKWWLMQDHYFIGRETSELEPLQIRSQMWWLDDCDLIGRFESLQMCFDLICSKLGIEKSVLLNLNASKHGHYSTYYDHESRAFVAEHFAQEIKRFNYKFEAQ